jgi:hypothetical protein
MANLPLTKNLGAYEIFTGEFERDWYDYDYDDPEEEYTCSTVDEFCERIKANIAKLVAEPYFIEKIHVHDGNVNVRLRREETQEEIEAKLRAKEKAAAAAIKRKAAAIKRKEAEIETELKLLAKLKAKHESPVSRDIET